MSNVSDMTSELAACVHTGRVATEDGRCPEHDSADCLVSVLLESPLFACVIPGFQCTHDHQAYTIRPVQWPPIPEQRHRS